MGMRKQWKINGILAEGETAYEAWLNSATPIHYSTVRIEEIGPLVRGPDSPSRVSDFPVEKVQYE